MAESWSEKIDRYVGYFEKGSALFGMAMLAKMYFGKDATDRTKADQILFNWWTELSDEQKEEIVAAGYHYKKLSLAFFNLVQGYPQDYLDLIDVIRES